MAGFTIEIQTTSPSETFTLPATNNGTFNATVYWGDTSSSEITAYDDSDLTHTYSSSGTYEIEIIGDFPGFSFNNGGDKAKCKDIITWGDSEDFGGFAYLYNAFRTCPIVTAGDGPILTDGLTSLGVTFYGCTSLTSMPSDLFDNCTAVTTLANICNGDTNINCQIPSLQNLTACTSYAYAFNLCAKLELTENCLFEYADKDTVFHDKSVSFSYAFQRTSYTGTQGTAPPLWKCDFGSGTPTKTGCFNNATGNGAGCDNYKNIPEDWGGSAVDDPTITDVDTDETITTNQTNVSWTGTNNLPYQYDGTYYLSDDADWGEGTVVEQTVQTWSDTGGTFDVVQGGLSTGTVYGWVLTDRGDHNATGIELTLASGGSVVTDVLGTGTFTLTGLSMTATRNYDTVLSGGTYTLTGGNIDAFPRIVDGLGTGTYALTGGDVDVLRNYQSTLNGGSYTLTGGDLTALLRYLCALNGGTYVLTGADIDTQIITGTVYTDVLSGGTFALTGLDMTATRYYVSTLNGGTYALTGLDMTAFRRLVDALNGGVYTLSGLDIDTIRVLHDILVGGVYVLTGGDINTYIPGGEIITDVLSGGEYALTGGDIETFLAFAVFAYAADIEWFFMDTMKYGDASFLLTYDYPPTWNVEAITGVTIALDKTDGTDLLTAQAATLFSGTLSAASAINAMEIAITATTEPTVGKSYHLFDADDPTYSEDIIVDTIENTGTNAYTLHLRHETKYTHESGDDIKGNFATYAADLSDTDTFTKGLEVVVTWNPDSDDRAITQVYQVAYTETLNVMWQQLSVDYPRTWELIRNQSSSWLGEYASSCRRRFAAEFERRGIDIARVVNSKMMQAAFLDFVRWRILTEQGDEFKEERIVAKQDWEATFSGIVDNQTVYQDTDQDGVKDSDEEQYHDFFPPRQYY